MVANSPLGTIYNFCFLLQYREHAKAAAKEQEEKKIKQRQEKEKRRQAELAILLQEEKERKKKRLRRSTVGKMSLAESFILQKMQEQQRGGENVQVVVPVFVAPAPESPRSSERLSAMPATPAKQDN